MDISAINTIQDFQEIFTGMKTKSIKEICKLHKIKLSRNGVTNKWVLLINIYEYIFGMIPEQHSREHQTIVSHMAWR